MKTQKILIANVPADGHFYPLTNLAMHLKKQGHDVRWYTQELYKLRIQKLGIPYYPFKRPPQLNQLNFEDFFSERKDITGQVGKMRFDMKHVFINRAMEYFEDIREIHSSFPFDLFIADIMCTVIPVVKEKLRVPVVAMGVIPLMETSKDLPPSGLGLMPSSNLAGRIKQSLLRWASNNIVLGDANKLFRAILKQNKIQAPRGNVFDILYRSASLVLQSGTPGFEYYRSDMSPNIRFIGPLLPYSTEREKSYELPPRVRKFKKRILVTQGTVEKNIEKLIVPTLEAFKNTDVLVIATTGGSQTKELRAKYPDDNYIIEDFIPFNDIMPSCDAYITNGGYGGVMLAIKNKLPMVVAGIHEGKNEINARIEYFKLGVNLRTETPASSVLKQAAMDLCDDSVFLKNHLQKLAEEFKQYDTLNLCSNYISQLLTGRKKIVLAKAIGAGQ